MVTELVDILVRQHRIIDRILSIGERPFMTAEQARSITSQLRHTFLLHAQAEERVVYPRFTAVARLAPWIHAARDEHESVANLLGELPDPGLDLAGWIAATADLRRTIRRHFAEEEQMLLPYVGGQLDIHEARDMSATLKRVLAPTLTERVTYP